MPFNKRDIIIRDFFTCQTCGKTGGSFQIAHKIKQGKGSEDYIKSWLSGKGYDWTVKQIRDNIINHPLNVVTVCSLKCNDAQNIFFKQEKRETLLSYILDDILNPF